MTFILKKKLESVRVFSRILRGLRKYRKGVDELSFEQLFMKNPQPMWIYDAGTLKFMEVNEAALTKYGYSREKFLSMSVTEIRPPKMWKSF